MSIAANLDKAFHRAETESYRAIAVRLPEKLVTDLRKWQFGTYGWTSPVNLLLTAAWYKWLFPQQDVCKIWAKDHLSRAIQGGFAIRSNDEKYTVPLVTKTSIAQGFCSPNSGMQGSRAIEKMRGAGRIDRNTPIDQSVSFDMSLFQNIINDINECDSRQAFDVFCLLLRIGIEIRERREAQSASLLNTAVSGSASLNQIVSFTKSVSDPQFVRIVAAYLVQPVVSSIIGSSHLQGMGGAKTAADTQSKSPGDFWFQMSSGEIIGAEVKDKSKQIGFDILAAIEARKANNPSMTHYFAISAANTAVSEQNLNDPFWGKNIEKLRTKVGINVICLNIDELAALFTFASGSISELLQQVTKQLTATIDLKPDTISTWRQQFLRDA